jgi:hypothetical protein
MNNLKQLKKLIKILQICSLIVKITTMILKNQINVVFIYIVMKDEMNEIL